jgi:exonuclease VII large subunit
VGRLGGRGSAIAGRQTVRKHVSRVVGLGHTPHTTLLDVVSDCAAKTPSLAGNHIREHIERYVYPLLALRSA